MWKAYSMEKVKVDTTLVMMAGQLEKRALRTFDK